MTSRAVLVLMVLLGAAGVLAAELTGFLMVEAQGGCGVESSWCGFGTAVLASAAGVAVTVLAAAGGALLAWSRRSATAGAVEVCSPAARATGVHGQS